MSVAFPRLRLLLRHTGGFRAPLAGGLALLFAGTAVAQLGPLITGAAVDAFTPNPRAGWPVLSWFTDTTQWPRRLWLPALLVVGIAAVAGTLNYLQGRLVARASQGIGLRLRDDLFDALQHLPVRWFDQQQTGDLVQRCTTDVDTLRTFVGEQLVQMLRVLTLLGAALPVMLAIDARLALWSVALMPVIFLAAALYFRVAARLNKDADDADGALSANIQENLTGIRVSRAFARQTYERGRFDLKNEDHRAKNWASYKAAALFWASSDLLCFGQLALVLFAGARLAARGDVSVGTLVTFLTYVSIFIFPARALGRHLSELSKALVASDRIAFVLDAPREAAPADPAEPPSPVRGRVTFEDVYFNHGEQHVLRGVSFDVPAGRTVALLGPSGAGKSTVGQLLMRFYDPDQGRVLLDGVDLQRLDRKWTRRQIAAVLQEPFLFSKTVADNIRLGRHAAEDAEVFAAADLAAVHDNIVAFDAGYDTTVGERGVTLSGGQRQRVAIARALLLRDAPVLVLDDALSAVDTRTERRILKALEQRRGKQTTILIAHRLSTLRLADEVIVLRAGRVEQRGTHDELLEQPGLYRRLWKIQTDAEEVEPELQEVA